MTDAPDEQPRRTRTVPLYIAIALVVAALVCGYIAGRPGYPIDTSADAGFLRDMSVHHAQAVDMAFVIRDKTDDPTLRAIAQDIARTQQEQIGRMQGWLVQWDLPARSSQPPMAWMAGHDGHGGEAPDTMPGYASEERMADLADADGVDAEVIFLETMIDHHRGGIEMAEAEARLGGDDMVTAFAAGMAEAQQTEIDLMNDLLEDRGAEPV
ncbi:DUF305 domain-containing protein [Nocardiopsis sediminis]|uniref:DUF305 domain-containing protein n=1 Tax=Nocardiopsis sediminis TaxID=1778267 RepID=A0ABV8FUL0_9ACTN